MLEGLAMLSPTTVLEVGCSCGPLLDRLTKAGYNVAGIDINADAVKLAKDSGFHASVGTLPDVLALFDDRSVDAVVSSYCLAYIAPDDLVTTLRECLRVARLGIVLVEPMAEPGTDAESERWAAYVEWRHDYFTALEMARAGLEHDPKLSTTLMARGPHESMNGVLVGQWIS